MPTKKTIVIIYAIIISFYGFALLFIIPGKEGASPQINQGYLDLREERFEKTKYIKLDKEWEFYWNKLLENNDFISNNQPKPDGYSTIPSIWKNLAFKGQNYNTTGFATYRINLITSHENKTWALLLREFSSAVKVFINDKQITEIGKVSDNIIDAIPFYHPEYVPFEAKDTIHLIVQVSNFHHRKGGFWHPVQLGPENNIRGAFLKMRFMSIFLLGSIFVFALYHFILFVYNKQKFTPLFFGLFCLSLFFRVSSVNDFVISEIPGISYQQIIFFQYNSMFLAVIFFALFVYSLYPEVFNKNVIIAVISVQVVFILIAIFTKTVFYTTLLIPFIYALVISAAYGVYGLVKALFLKKDSAELFLLGYIILIITVANDVLNNVFIAKTIDVISVGLFLFILTQSIAISYRYSLSFQRSEDLSLKLNNANKELEELLAEYENVNKELTLKNINIGKINKELSKAKEKAEESDKLKSSFLANLSHEIRTPLNGILGFAELLKSDHYSQDQKTEFIDIINSSGKYLLSIINDIIDTAKIEANKLIITYKEFDLNELLQELKFLISQNQVFQSKKGVDLELQCPVKDKFMIKSDKIRLKQILLNLLNNAVKFTNEGKIEFGYRLNNTNSLFFYVSDTGIGIPVEDHKIIFERFRQSNEKYIKNTGGTGLGLAISKGLTNLLGGDIWLESEPGKGSAFYFTINYQPGPDKIVEEIPVDINSERIDLSNKTILIAEDNEVNFDLIKNILLPVKIQILHAKTGNKAVEIAMKNKAIDLILMDIKLPGLNGFEATNQIKSKKNIPIIAITAFASEEDKQRAFEAGCNGYLAKPVSANELIDHIRLFIT